MARVSLIDVSKTYPGGVDAVVGVSIEADDGEFLVLVGPSGCGKTTMLRLIAGLERPTRGRIRVGPRAVNDVPPRDRGVAMVFQNHALYPHLSVRGNLALALRLRGMPREQVDRRVSRAARMLGIEYLLGRRPGQLSGGQRQRVALGRAIVREPEAYLFDEPLSNLDAGLRDRMRVELRALHRRLRTTTIHVTHDQMEAMTLGDRIAVMDAGRVRQVGTPMEVYEHPADRFVAGFIGSPPMNFIAGTVACRGSRPALVPSGRDAPVLSLERAPGADRLAAGDRIVLGLRPRSLTPAEAGQAGDLCLVVEAVEHLGDEADLVCVLDWDPPVRLVARVGTDRRVQVGATLAFRLDMRAAHLFEDAARGLNVVPCPPAGVADASADESVRPGITRSC